MSLHLNGSSTLMKNLQLLFAFLAHTQVYLSSVQFPVCPLKHCSNWHCWVGVLNERINHTCWWFIYHVVCPPESSIFSKEFFRGFSAAVVYSWIPARLLRVFALSTGQVNSENGILSCNYKKDVCLRVALGIQFCCKCLMPDCADFDILLGQFKVTH